MNIYVCIYKRLYVVISMCVCVTERERERETLCVFEKKQTHLCSHKCVCVCVCVCVRVCVLFEKKKLKKKRIVTLGEI
jgi:hypothetical protein